MRFLRWFLVFWLFILVSLTPVSSFPVNFLNPGFFDFDGFVGDLVKKHGLHSVVYFHDSESLQDASFDNPRTVIYSDDANTIVAFNENKIPGELQRFEFMQY